MKHRKEIVEWHKDNGGHAGRLAGHALRLLHEAVECAVAAGASRAEIEARVATEVDKAQRRREFDPRPDVRKLGEELADVSFLTDVLAAHAGVSLDDERAKKLKVLRSRKWQADADGVLWRDRPPGKLSGFKMDGGLMTYDGELMPLAGVSVRYLQVLVNAFGHVVSVDRFMALHRGTNDIANVYVYIMRVRRALGELAGRGGPKLTVRNHYGDGYSLVEGT